MERDASRPLGTRWLAHGWMIVLVFSGLSCRGELGSPPPPAVAPPRLAGDFVTHPPVARSLAVRLVDAGQGTAQLLVGYAQDPRLGPRIATRLGGEPVELRDDGTGGDTTAGDSVYTGTIRLDVDALASRWREVAAIMASPGFTPRLPRFAGREVIGATDLSLLDVEAQLADLRGDKPVSLNGTCSVSNADPKASLFVTHPDVITDPARTYIPCGPSGPRGTPDAVWSFGHLMHQLAGGPGVTKAQVSDFIEKWLAEWQKTGTGTNGWPLPARPLLDTQIVQPWKAASAGAGVKFDPDQAPFRLLAIVNRIDLAKGSIYGSGGGPGSAGEVRFVFGALSAQCQPLRATVIFEYKVDRGDCMGLKQWAQDWIALSGLTLGGPEYNDALEALTAQVTTPGTIGQLRTDELSFDDPAGGSDWDLREFHLEGGALVQGTVAQTPQDTLNGTSTLADYVNANAAGIAIEVYEVKPDFPAGQHFLGDHAFGKPVLTFWNAPGILPFTAPDGTITSASELRHTFSRNTCNGCHNAETGTSNTHVNPMLDPGAPSQLSGFLTGITGVPDPAGAAVTRDFADLERRKVDLASTASLGCLCQFLRVRIDAPH